MISKLKDEAKALKAETYALYLASKDPRVPWYAKVLLACVVAYALSPIDLIPDFVPVIGLLDDLILVPLGLRLVVKMVPADVLADCRERAKDLAESKPKSLFGLAIVLSIWLLAIFILWSIFRKWYPIGTMESPGG
ncbi:MAG: DUF1232 domain-containing protein [Cyanobacteria bacterium REEB67]|nr:DUF1232 domain-containing protein [Cyanobacteria bacterium REEB67]